MNEDKLKEFKQYLTNQVLIPQAQAYVKASGLPESQCEVIIDIYKDMKLIDYLYTNVHSLILDEEQMEFFVDKQLEMFKIHQSLVETLGEGVMEDLNKTSWIKMEQWWGINEEVFVEKLVDALDKGV